LVDDPRLDHLVIEVVTLAGALADAGEHRQATVLLGDVVDELEHVDGLADPGAAEQADLAALGERHEEVDDLDAGDEQVLATGTEIGAPVAATARPRFKPSEEPMAMVRTTPSPSCCCTSSVRSTSLSLSAS